MSTTRQDHPRRAGALRLLLAATLAAAALTPAPGRAETLTDRVEVHGYGDQAWMRTTANAYYGTGPGGSWKNDFAGLVVAATLTEKSKLWAQLQASGRKGSDLTWLFVDYQLGDAWRLHAGRVKLPLGFYNELIDAKSLQLSELEPSLYQTYRTGADMVHDAYQGVGADWEQDLGAAGRLTWQAWGGNIYDRDKPDDSRDRHAWGGRLAYAAPLDGLTLMASGYRTRVELLADGSYTNEDRLIGSAAFQSGALEVKAEYAWHKAALHEDGGNVYGTAWYFQGGYTFAERWTPYLRYDDAMLDRSQRQDPSYRQRTVVVGFGARLTPHLGLRIENHFNRGYGLPVATGEVEPGAGAGRWNLTVAALNFQF